MPSPSVRRARAFAPAHVSGIFVPRLEARDPRARGSLGAGLVLGAGVSASVEWSPSPRRSLSVRGDRPGPLPISAAVADRLLAARPGRLRVRLAHDLPIGRGFGASASGALATALAVASALGLPRSRAVQVAHLAELHGGGGLGGVAAILGGGLEVRVRPGIPPWGRILHASSDASVHVGWLGGPLSTARLLAHPDRVRQFGSVGAHLFDALPAAPDWEAFWSASERFTDAVGLAPARLRPVLRGLRRRGARAAQPMFGPSFVAWSPTPRVDHAIERWLARNRVPHRRLPLAPGGARSLRADGRDRGARAF